MENIKGKISVRNKLHLNENIYKKFRLQILDWNTWYIQCWRTFNVARKMNNSNIYEWTHIYGRGSEKEREIQTSRQMEKCEFVDNFSREQNKHRCSQRITRLLYHFTTCCVLRKYFKEYEWLFGTSTYIWFMLVLFVLTCISRIWQS